MNEKTIHPLGDIVVRIPFLPVSVAEDLFSGSAPQTEKLLTYLNRCEIREAIYHASPSLQASLEKWRNGHPLPEKKKNLLIRKTMEYLIRMSARCTPFGLLAGISSGTWSDRNLIVLDGKYEIQLRPEISYCRKLAIALEKDGRISDKMAYFPNNSIYRIFNELRYIGISKSQGKIRINSIENAEHLDGLIHFCRDGKTSEEIITFLTEHLGDHEETEEYFHNLLKYKILVTELEPNVTGVPYYERLREKMAGIHPANLKNTSFSCTKQYCAGLFFHSKVCHIDRSMVPDLTEAIKVLMHLSPGRSTAFLHKFITAFRKNYGNREIPLMTALDPETGINIEHILHPAGHVDAAGNIPDMTTKGFRNLQLNERDFFLLKKIWEAFMNHSGTIRINLSELPFQEDWSMLSGTFNVLFSILKQNDNHRAEMIHLHGISGFSACHLLSRFALENQQIQQMLTEAAKREARETQGIAAEVVYCPQGNEADLLLRPVLRDYEIPVLAHSTLDTGHQILPADLMVSIKNGDIQLRSKQHHQPIIPFASHALDYRKCNLPLHRFLCELQTQHHGSGLLFEWGDLEKLFPFLPRIITGKTLLVPASWHFDYADLSRFIHPGKKEELKKMITRWRYRHKIPAKVLFAENDQELLLDLNSIAGIDLFLSLCRNKPDIHLKEFLMDQNLLVKSPEGQHLHEIIAPFYLETQQPNNADHE